MRNLNFPIDDALLNAAKISAARCRLTLKAWVTKAILDELDPRDRPADVGVPHETRLEPLDEI